MGWPPPVHLRGRESSVVDEFGSIVLLMAMSICAGIALALWMER